MNLLIGEGLGGGELGREVRKLVLFYISKANKFEIALFPNFNRNYLIIMLSTLLMVSILLI